MTQNADLGAGREPRWCASCNQQEVRYPWRRCDVCGDEQIEPFREGWDESD